MLMLIPAASLLAQEDWMMKSKKVKEPASKSSSRPAEAMNSPLRTSRPSGLNDPLSTSVPSAVSPYDAYKLGEVMYVIDYFSYVSAIAPNVKDKFKEHRDLLAKVDPNEKTLAAFDQYTACMTAFSWDKPWNQWSADDQTKWNKTGCGWTDIWNGVKADLQNNPGATFFVWLGFDTMRSAWDLPKAINEDGYKISEKMTSIKTGIDNFAYTRDSADFKNLAPDVQQAIQTIAGFKAKLGGDPLSSGEEITAADVNKMAEAAKVIRQAAKNQKLLA